MHGIHTIAEISAKLHEIHTIAEIWVDWVDWTKWAEIYFWLSISMDLVNFLVHLSKFFIFHDYENMFLWQIKVLTFIYLSIIYPTTYKSFNMNNRNFAEICKNC